MVSGLVFGAFRYDGFFCLGFGALGVFWFQVWGLGLWFRASGLGLWFQV